MLAKRFVPVSLYPVLNIVTVVIQCVMSMGYFILSGDSVVAIPVEPAALQVLQATPTHSGQIYTTPVGAAVVNYNPVPVAPSAPNHAPNQPQDWYKEQKITGHPAYIQSEP